MRSDRQIKRFRKECKLENHIEIFETDHSIFENMYRLDCIVFKCVSNRIIHLSIIAN